MADNVEIIKDSGVTDIEVIQAQIAKIQNDILGLNPRNYAGLGSSALMSLMDKNFYGDGSSDELNIDSGTTNFDLGYAATYTKNYKKISITGTGAITFTNPHSKGTTIIFKNQGSLTLTSTTNPCIDLRLIGGSAGNGWSGLGGRAGGGTLYTADGDETYAGGSGGGNIVNGANGGNGYLVFGYGGVPTSHIVNIGGESYSMSATDKIVHPGGGGLTSGTTGGKGGGALLIGCRGDLNFTSTINTAGQNAGNLSVTFGVHSAGGGGAGGSVMILYNGQVIANTGTITVTGGTGGTVPDELPTYLNAPGGDGSAGQSLISKNKYFD